MAIPPEGSGAAVGAAGGTSGGHVGQLGLRELVRKSPGLVLGLIVLSVAAVLFADWRRAPKPYAAFYTVDDGRTWFALPFRPAPFEYDGREASQVMVYTADGGATTFAGYLVRFSPEGKAKMEALLKDRAALGRQASIPVGWMEVKRPGDSAWVRGPGVNEQGGASDAYNQILDVKSPSGGKVMLLSAQ